MPSNFQFGYEHYLYLGIQKDTNDAFNPKALNSRPGDASPDIHYNGGAFSLGTSGVASTGLWLEYANVRTVNVGGNSNSVDITTRDEARSGFSSEVDATTTGEMTFEARYKPTDASGAPVDLIYEALLKAWLTKKEIAAIDLDKPLGQAGAQGLVANWTVTFGQQKEVQGVVITNVTMKLSSFPNYIRAGSASATDFDPIS